MFAWFSRILFRGLDELIPKRRLPPQTNSQATRIGFRPSATATCILACFALFGCAALAAIGQPAERPNILLIMADDLGIGDLGCYGGQVLRTPNIDRLASEGMRFTQAYSGASVCAPSRCALMTGRHMGHASVRGNWEVFPEGQAPLNQDEMTVATLLRQAGYTTGICGKWGLGGPGSGSEPNDKGFDFFFGYLCQRHAHRFLTDYLYRNGQKFEILQSPDRRVNAHALIAEETLRFIRENRDRPWFLFCAWTLPHGPYRADQVPDLSAYTHTDWNEAQKVYAAMVEWLDRDVGRLVRALEELDWEQKTLVIFSSDNGGVASPQLSNQFSSRLGLRGAKGELSEGGLRVPLIIRWSGQITPGTTCDYPVAFWDFLPTAAELAGVPPPQGIDGISLVPIVQGRTTPGSRALYWEQYRGKRLEQAVRWGRWKAFRAGPGASIELFDLLHDPTESANVAAQYPEIVAEIAAIMEKNHQPMELPPADPRVWEKYREDNRRLDQKLGLIPADKP